MEIFGWAIASFGTIGLCGSVVMEIIKKEPVYLLTCKISAGVLGIGGVILATLSL